MKKFLIGTDVVILEEIHGFKPLYDKWFNWEWWTPNGLATREVFSDGEVIIYPQSVNKEGVILHLDGFVRRVEEVEKKKV